MPSVLMIPAMRSQACFPWRADHPPAQCNVRGRHWPLLCGLARGQAPAYSAAGIVNAANYAPGPFAANSVVSIFGTNLCNCSTGAPATEIAGGTLPAA